jgi:two-component system, NarL family, sensor kinase
MIQLPEKMSLTERTVVLGLLIILLGLLVIFIVTLLLLYNHRKYKAELFVKSMAVEHAREIEKVQKEIHEQTLHEVSQELHDNIGQSLSIVKLQLSLLLLNTSGELFNRLTETKKVTYRVIMDLSDLTKTLNREYTRTINLEMAIENEVKRLQKTGLLSIVMSVTGSPVELDPKKELVIIRMFQEILNNIIKHSKAKNSSVILDYTPHHFTLEVSDDGIGFEPEKIKNLTGVNGSGLGLKNISYRSKLIGASLEIKTQLKKGTQISVKLPVKDHKQDAAKEFS